MLTGERDTVASTGLQVITGIGSIVGRGYLISGVIITGSWDRTVALTTVRPGHHTTDTGNLISRQHIFLLDRTRLPVYKVMVIGAAKSVIIDGISIVGHLSLLQMDLNNSILGFGLRKKQLFSKKTKRGYFLHFRADFFFSKRAQL